MAENPSNDLANIKKLNKQMQYLAYTGRHHGKMDIDIYIDLYREWLKLMSHLGPYVKMGFKALEQNIYHFLRNRDIMVKIGFITKEDSAYSDILEFCTLEVTLGIQGMNEDTNKEILDNLFNNPPNQDNLSIDSAKCNSSRSVVSEDMRKDFYMYQSTSRTLLRGAWFFDYCRFIFRLWVDDRNILTSEMAR